MIMRTPTLFRVTLAAIVLGWLAPGRTLAQDALTKISQGLPKDAAAFVKRRIYCNHWSDEDPYDAARAREIASHVKKLRCSTLDRDETRLRTRYAGNTSVLNALTDVQSLYP